MANNPQYEQLNKSAKEWARLNAGKMRRLVGSLTLRDKIAVYKAVRNAIKNNEYRPLASSIGAAIRKESGQVSRINFLFAKQGIYLQHGVGKGRRVRSSEARPKPWITPILDIAIDDLAAILAGEYADIAASEIKFFIPGIIDRRIKINNG
jgi:hypothetical protein